MTFFSNLKDKLAGSINKVAGNTDFLEAVCASAALVASADGEISDEEIQTTTKVVASNPTLTKAFKPAVIEKTIDQMLKRAQAGRTGRMGLYKEIEQVASVGDMADTVYLVALDVAETDGNVAPKEREALNLIASKLGVNPNSYNV